MVSALPKTRTGPGGLGNDADGRVVRRGRGAGRERERIGARDRDHLVQDGGQRHAVDVAQRGVVGVVVPGQRDARPGVRRRTAASAASAARHRRRSAARGGAAAGRPAPSGAPNWPAAAIGAIPSLRSRCIWFLSAITIWG